MKGLSQGCVREDEPDSKKSSIFFNIIYIGRCSYEIYSHLIMRNKVGVLILISNTNNMNVRVPTSLYSNIILYYNINEYMLLTRSKHSTQANSQLSFWSKKWSRSQKKKCNGSGKSPRELMVRFFREFLDSHSGPTHIIVASYQVACMIGI